MDNQTVSSTDLLNVVSRSFALTIPMLEENKRDEVENQYLLARLIDTIEDSSHELDVKKRLMFEFLNILNPNLDNRLNIPVDNENNKRMLNEVLNKLSREVSNEGEILLINNFGTVYNVYNNISDEVKKESHNWLYRMGYGMLLFLDKREKSKTKEGIKNFCGIKDFSNLDRYCFFVAGTVGLYLNSLIAITDEVKLSDKKAEAFGKYLQKINIIRDFYEDAANERYFWPSELFNGFSPKDILIDETNTNTENDKVIGNDEVAISNKELAVNNKLSITKNSGCVAAPYKDGLYANVIHMNKKTKENIKRTQDSALEKMIESARANQNDTFEYIMSIPKNKLPGYRQFCQTAAIMGAETLSLLEKNNAVFGKEGIKIPKDTLYTIIQNNVSGYYTNDKLAEFLLPKKSGMYQ